MKHKLLIRVFVPLNILVSLIFLSSCDQRLNESDLRRFILSVDSLDMDAGFFNRRTEWRRERLIVRHFSPAFPESGSGYISGLLDVKTKEIVPGSVEFSNSDDSAKDTSQIEREMQIYANLIRDHGLISFDGISTKGNMVVFSFFGGDTLLFSRSGFKGKLDEELIILGEGWAKKIGE